MGRASRASSVVGPDSSYYYLTEKTELGQLIMHAYKEPEELGKITSSKEGLTINQDEKESGKLAARGNLHHRDQKCHNEMNICEITIIITIATLCISTPPPSFSTFNPFFISTGQYSLVTQTLKVCGEFLILPPQMLIIMLLQQPPSLQ